MKHHSLLIALTLGASCLAQAADWSDSAISYRYASGQSEPGVADKVSKNIWNFTHVSGDKWGSNFFTIDYLKSDGADKNSTNTAGATEFYGFYKRSFSLNALSGKQGFGPFKDLSLTGRMDMGTKNTAFAPAPVKYRFGLSAALPVRAGFWDVGVESYREYNHNGLVSGSNAEVSFNPTYALSSAWSIPVGPGHFGGFLDVIGPKGKDGFGADTSQEILARVTYLFDLGASSSGFKAGVGLEYWANKFGCDNSTATPANSCLATTPMLLLEYHM